MPEMPKMPNLKKGFFTIGEWTDRDKLNQEAINNKDKIKSGSFRVATIWDGVRLYAKANELDISDKKLNEVCKEILKDNNIKEASQLKAGDKVNVDLSEMNQILELKRKQTDLKQQFNLNEKFYLNTTKFNKESQFPEREAISSEVKINRKIEDFSQRKYRGVGDCWLLAGVKALSNTDKGKQIIKEAITLNQTGDVTVSLKGVKKEYTFTEKEIQEAKAEKIYSKGDDDMLVIELAVEKYREETDYKSPFFEKTDHILEGGVQGEAKFLLTGKSGKSFFTGEAYARLQDASQTKIDKKNKRIFKRIERSLNKQDENPTKYATTVNFKASHKNKKISAGHGFIVNKVEGNNIFLTEPHKLSKEVVIKKEEFLNDLYTVNFWKQ